MVMMADHEGNIEEGVHLISNLMFMYIVYKHYFVYGVAQVFL